MGLFGTKLMLVDTFAGYFLADPARSQRFDEIMERKIGEIQLKEGEEDKLIQELEKKTTDLQVEIANQEFELQFEDSSHVSKILQHIDKDYEWQSKNAALAVYVYDKLKAEYKAGKATETSDSENFTVYLKSTELTGLYNRRHFMSILQNELERSKRTKNPISVALFDIDDFKHYNDTLGHVKGDKLLQELGMLLMKQVRTIDTVGRYGGEEFIVVLPETKSNEAKVVAERIRKAIETHHFESEENQPSGRVTISLGLVTCMNGTLTEEEMIKSADKNMYKAKAAGKNKVVATVVLDRSLNPVEVFD